ncbi:cardiolipin synthase (CMP-forming) isoform X2 [Gavia stellata]|uniref:cardiolipin synthase (CMP-forming) isoform X2 n=1 Tax=Gavia stellata TaxID=37040 RepID=UPI00289D9CD3|nr:cardiolipin synthase (CMP-forming) isoform X2 [Gavia stellata]
MLAAAWLGRGFWGLLRGAGRRRPGSTRPLSGRPGGAAAEGRGGGAGGRRHGNSGAFCLAAGAGHQRLLRAPAAAWRLLSGGAAPPEPPRERRVAGRYAELYENPWTIPNILSMARMGLAPVLGYLIVEENFNVALGVFVLAGVTDLLDGFIARNWANQKSALGSALDPLADKILISVLYVSLTCANLIPVSLTSMIILRDVALIAAVFYVRYKTLSPPRTLSRYFNPCYATAQLKPTFISKMNTAVQLILVAASLAAPVFNYVDSIYLQTLWCITAFTTVASAYSYYHYGRKTVQVINNK